MNIKVSIKKMTLFTLLSIIFWWFFLLGTTFLISDLDHSPKIRGGTLISEMGQTRARAALYMQEHETHKGVCNDEDMEDLFRSILRIARFDDIRLEEKHRYCKDDEDFWLAVVPYVEHHNQKIYWCTDYTGYSQRVNSNDLSNATECADLIIQKGPFRKIWNFLFYK